MSDKGASQMLESPEYLQHRNSLTRQVTIQLSPEEYERLYFQPRAAKGDLSKRLGNPTLLGLLGFLVPLTCIVFVLLDFQGSSAASLPTFLPVYYFYGGIAMEIAGILEFILGNTYPFVVFCLYGAHFVNAGYNGDPAHPISAAFGAGAAGAADPSYLAGQGIYNVVMVLVTFIFLIGSVRTNVPFVIVFFTLVFLFGFFAAAQFKLAAGNATTAIYYLKVAGGFGFVTLLMGWYLAIITVCAATGVPCPLPVFDLSSKLFVDNKKAQMQEHAGVMTQDVPA